MDHNDNYCIKEGYRINGKPQYYLDNPNELIYQPDVYELAFYLAERSNAQFIIDIGGGSGEKLRNNGEFKIIAVDFGANVEFLNKQSHIDQVIEFNLEYGMPDIPYEILKDSVIIFSDVIEHLIQPDSILNALSEISNVCKFMLISTPDRVKARGIGDFGPPKNIAHVREWSIEELDSLLRRYHFSPYLIGHTINTNVHLWKNTILVISGSLAFCRPTKEVRTLAIVNAYNEEDIIVETINHLINQGVAVKVIDNWSTDSTYHKVKELSEINNNISVQRYPERPTEYYEWGSLLENVEDLANDLDYDWFIHYDADEIRESPWRDFTLNQAISFVDSCGYSAVDFTILDFRPTNKEVVSNNHEDNLKFFEFGKRGGHFKQIKCWKKYPGIKVDLSSSGGHEAQFPGRSIFPIKFLTKHYPLRNPHQAFKKVFNERNNRISPEEREKGWHTQYSHYNPEDASFLWDYNSLIPWNRNVFMSEYLVERISGIGIKR